MYGLLILFYLFVESESAKSTGSEKGVARMLVDIIESSSQQTKVRETALRALGMFRLLRILIWITLLCACRGIKVFFITMPTSYILGAFSKKSNSCDFRGEVLQAGGCDALANLIDAPCSSLRYEYIDCLLAYPILISSLNCAEIHNLLIYIFECLYKNAVGFTHSYV